MSLVLSFLRSLEPHSLQMMADAGMSCAPADQECAASQTMHLKADFLGPPSSEDAAELVVLAPSTSLPTVLEAISSSCYDRCVRVANRAQRIADNSPLRTRAAIEGAERGLSALELALLEEL